MAIAVIGMLDEREQGLKLISEQVEKRGYEACLIDISIGTGAIKPQSVPEVSARDLARTAGSNIEKVKGALAFDRHKAIEIMVDGLGKKLLELSGLGRLQGCIGVGGATGALITLPAMSLLPFGLPKVLISSAAGHPPLAAGLAAYYALRDITVMHSVVDTVGMNNMVKQLMISGAGAVCGMAEGYEPIGEGDKPSIALTEFNFCEKGAHYIRALLEKDFNVISFHATGFGDRGIVDLYNEGTFKAFIDLVPAGYSEYLLGGNRAAGPHRLDAGRDLARPYIITPCGFDMISCGPVEREDKKDPLWVSRNLQERKLLVMDAIRAEARTNPDEMKLIAQEVAKKLNQRKYKHLVKFILPTDGFSSPGTKGGALHDPVSDEAFIRTLKESLDKEIEIIEVKTDINTQDFAYSVVQVLEQTLSKLRRS